MTGLEILGTGRCLPQRCVTNDDMARMVETSDEWISTRTGIRQRYFCGEDEGVVSLSAGAARKALEKAGVSADQLPPSPRTASPPRWPARSTKRWAAPPPSPALI